MRSKLIHEDLTWMWLLKTLLISHYLLAGGDIGWAPLDSHDSVKLVEWHIFKSNSEFHSTFRLRLRWRLPTTTTTFLSTWRKAQSLVTSGPILETMLQTNKTNNDTRAAVWQNAKFYLMQQARWESWARNFSTQHKKQRHGWWVMNKTTECHPILLVGWIIQHLVFAHWSGEQVLQAYRPLQASLSVLYICSS